MGRDRHLSLTGKGGVLPIEARHVWTAIDAIAAERGLTPSGLARTAGLHATTFNRSKRGDGGRARWPALATIVSVLAVSELSFVAFAARVEEIALGDDAARARMTRARSNSSR